ncbi:MAG: Sec-independent protein translocase subunit TatA/TatB [Actinomycetota bacterium]
MGNIGIGELAVIVMLILLVFGPNKLPEIMRSLGKAYRVFQEETQRATAVLRESIEQPPPKTPPGPGAIDVPDGVQLPTPQPAPQIDESARAHEDT